MTKKLENHKKACQFAIITDSHIRLPSGDDEGGYPSNHYATARNRYVVERLNAFNPDFVIHLGDVVHPIPALSTHEEAVALAGDVYADLNVPLYVLPGNHDIGDKHNAWMPAPVVDETSHQVFKRHWGPLYRSFDYQDCHFVLLDTPVMNSNLAREHEQRQWLEDDLGKNRAAGRRLFVFTHYPLFLYEPDEPRHYDNLDEPARSWLLDLLHHHSAEAVFSGHVHNFFFNRTGATLHYILPSTVFVRPEYSELAAVSPGDEFGRDDSGKLGFFMVQVRARGHTINPICTYGYSAGIKNREPVRIEPTFGTSRIGVTLRHAWAEPLHIPADGLDEFTRKQARNDTVIQALWEMGCKKVRVPVADLASEHGLKRMTDLAATGIGFTVFSIGIPGEETIALADAHSGLICAWEVIAPRDQLVAAVDRFKGLRDRPKTNINLSVYAAPVAPMLTDDPVDPGAVTFQHFASHGFALNESGLSLNDQVDGATFRVSPFDKPWDCIAAMADWSSQTGLDVLANVQLPRIDEGVVFDDDAATANFVVETVAAAMAHPEVKVFLDTFMDHDRGYYPRHGLIDRRGAPRPALHAIRNLESFFDPSREVSVLKRIEGGRTFYLQSQTLGAILHLTERGVEHSSLSFRPPNGAMRNAGVSTKAGQYIDLQTGETIPFDGETNSDGVFMITPQGEVSPGPRLLILEGL